MYLDDIFPVMYSMIICFFMFIGRILENYPVDILLFIPLGYYAFICHGGMLCLYFVDYKNVIYPSFLETKLKT